MVETILLCTLNLQQQNGNGKQKQDKKEKYCIFENYQHNAP